MDATTLLKGSIEVVTLKKHLGNMLDEWEAQFETGTEYSYESKQQYIEAAKFMSRNQRLIELVEQSLES